METLLWLLGSVGAASIGAAVYLWRQIANLHHKAAQGDLWRLKYEEAARQIESLKKARKLHSQPQPDSFTDIVDQL